MFRKRVWGHQETENTEYDKPWKLGIPGGYLWDIGEEKVLKHTGKEMWDVTVFLKDHEHFGVAML